MPRAKIKSPKVKKPVIKIPKAPKPKPRPKKPPLAPKGPTKKDRAGRSWWMPGAKGPGAKKAEGQTASDYNASRRKARKAAGWVKGMGKGTKAAHLKRKKAAAKAKGKEPKMGPPSTMPVKPRIKPAIGKKTTAKASRAGAVGKKPGRSKLPYQIGGSSPMPKKKPKRRARIKAGGRR